MIANLPRKPHRYPQIWWCHWPAVQVLKPDCKNMSLWSIRFSDIPSALSISHFNHGLHLVDVRCSHQSTTKRTDALSNLNISQKNHEGAWCFHPSEHRQFAKEVGSLIYRITIDSSRRIRITTPSDRCRQLGEVNVIVTYENKRSNLGAEKYDQSIARYWNSQQSCKVWVQARQCFSAHLLTLGTIVENFDQQLPCWNTSQWIIAPRSQNPTYWSQRFLLFPKLHRSTSYTKRTGQRMT